MMKAGNAFLSKIDSYGRIRRVYIRIVKNSENKHNQISLKKNLIYSGLYQVLAILLPLLTAPYISRVLHAEGIGIFTYTSTIANYFVLFGMLGMSNYGNRTIAQVRDDKINLSVHFWSLWLFQLFVYLISLLLYFFYITRINHNYAQIFKILILYIIGGMLDISWFFWGIENIRITVVRNALIKIVTFICIFVFVKKSEDIWLYAMIMSGGTLLSQAYLWFHLKEHILIMRPNFSIIKSAVKPIIVLFVPVLAYSIYKMMDKIMLGRICSMSEVGYYENASKLINVPMAFLSAFGTVMLPRLSFLKSHGKEREISGLVSKSLIIITLLYSYISCALIGFSEVFVELYYGMEYSRTSFILKILSCTCLIVAWASVIRTQLLIPYSRDNVYVISTSIGAIVNFACNIFLIKLFSGAGAAIGTVMAEMCVLLIQFYSIRRYYNFSKIFTRYSVYIAIAIIDMIMINQVLCYLKMVNWGVFLFFSIAYTLVYLLLCFIVSYIRKDDVYKLLYILLDRLKTVFKKSVEQ